MAFSRLGKALGESPLDIELPSRDHLSLCRVRLVLGKVDRWLIPLDCLLCLYLPHHEAFPPPPTLSFESEGLVC